VKPTFTLDPSVNERFTVGDWPRAVNDFTDRLLREFAEPPESVRVMLAGPLGYRPHVLLLEGIVPA